MKSGKPYSALGEVMDRIARRRKIRGPYNIGDYVLARSEKAPSRSQFSDYFHGRSRPNQDHLTAFCEAFECTLEEVMELTWFHSFGDECPEHLKDECEQLLGVSRH